MLVLLAKPLLGGNWPNTRIDHQTPYCGNPAITTGPASAGAQQPLYAAFECPTDSGSDIYFQRSTDAGLTWLSEDVLVRHGAYTAECPDILADQSGRVYIVYSGCDTGRSVGHVYCTGSSNQGVTWSSPAQVDDNTSAVRVERIRAAADTGGRLFVAWGDSRTGFLRVWSSVSTDRGASWQANVRCDNDTVSADDGQPDVAVQPGTNAYLVALICPYYDFLGRVESQIVFTKSTDGGRSFSPAWTLDSNMKALYAQIVADSGYVVSVFITVGELSDYYVWSAVSSDGGASWPVRVDILGNVAYNLWGDARLAIDRIGGVHCVFSATQRDTSAKEPEIMYVSSIDHGLTWSAPESISDTIHGVEPMFPDVAADSAGHAYCVWQSTHVYFATDLFNAVAEARPSVSSGLRLLPTIVRGVLEMPLTGDRLPLPASLLNLAGRRVLDLKPGPNDVSRLAPGVYFVREQPQASSSKPQAVRKVVLTR
jgi:hypothetical protein